jgi:hypothetical protein
VSPLYVEALHLLVKTELAASIHDSFTGLRARVVDLGPRDSATFALASAVLDFMGYPVGTGSARGGVQVRSFELGELEALLARGEAAALPDAVFHLATVPSKLADTLVRSGRYRLVALPFADAFRLSVLIEAPPTGVAAEIERPAVVDTTIPAFVYGTWPAAPPQPLHTLGARLLLLCREGVSAATVRRLLDTVFGSRFARVVEPPLASSLVAEAAHVELHPGARAFADREKSVLTAERVDALSNTLSVLGALVGGGLFLRSAWRQRRQARTDELFGSYMQRVAEVERKAVELELSETLELEPLNALQRDLLQLQSDALERFAAGELGGQATLSDLLAPLNAAREHVNDLLLHLRETLEERAETEGRSPRALWLEAVARAKRPAPGP